jgi:hypothetical protein
MFGSRAMMSWHCSGVTVGFLKKLPALPITRGSGSLARRMAQTQSKMPRVGWRDAGFGHLALQVEVAEHRLPGLGQAQPHAQDQRPAGQPEVAVGAAAASA